MLLQILVLCVLFGADLVHSQIGDPCRNELTKSTGTCKRIDNCRHLVDDVVAGKPYTRCGFHGITQLVCCPSASEYAAVVGPRISERKCIEYSEGVYATQRIKGKMRKINICGHKVNPFITKNVKPGEFPQMALLGFNVGDEQFEWTCAGSLISDEFVMTAAHCTRTSLYGNVTNVRLGELDISTTSDVTRTENFEIAEVIMHPNYTPASYYNDIALLKLDRKVKFDAYKRPACLPTKYIGRENSATATGWGHTQSFGRSSGILQKEVLQLFSYAECQELYAQNNETKLQGAIRDNQQICAGHRHARDTCQGSYNGLLQVYHSTVYCMYTILGVASFGSACGVSGTAEVFTDVHGYLDWIERIVWPGL